MKTHTNTKGKCRIHIYRLFHCFCYFIYFSIHNCSYFFYIILSFTSRKCMRKKNNFISFLGEKIICLQNKRLIWKKSWTNRKTDSFFERMKSFWAIRKYDIMYFGCMNIECLEDITCCIITRQYSICSLEKIPEHQDVFSLLYINTNSPKTYLCTTKTSKKNTK
jgi:hypothetical protein